MEFTIAIPSFNSEKWLPGCLDAVLKQSYRLFRVAVLDGGSTDGTMDYLKSIEDPRLDVYATDQRLSIEENWARIQSLQKAEYMTILGHDDLLYPDFLENIANLIRENPVAAIFHTHFDFIDQHGRTLRACQPMPSQLSYEELFTRFLEGRIDLMATGYVVRSRDYDEAGGIPVAYSNLLFADFELWLRLVKNGGMVVASKSAFAFRVHQSVTTTSKDSIIQAGLEHFVDFLAGEARNDSETAALIRTHGPAFLLRYVRSYAHRLLRTPPGKRKGLTVASLINRSKEMAERLQVGGDFHPEKDRSLSLSKAIDQNILLGGLFRLARKIYPGPFTR